MPNKLRNNYQNLISIKEKSRESIQKVKNHYMRNEKIVSKSIDFNNSMNRINKYKESQELLQTQN